MSEERIFRMCGDLKAHFVDSNVETRYDANDEPTPDSSLPLLADYDVNETEEKQLIVSAA